MEAALERMPSGVLWHTGHDSTLGTWPGGCRMDGNEQKVIGKGKEIHVWGSAVQG